MLTGACDRYLLPLQFAVDKAIARQQNNEVPNLEVSQYMFTDKTQEEYEQELRKRYVHNDGTAIRGSFGC